LGELGLKFTVSDIELMNIEQCTVAHGEKCQSRGFEYNECRLAEVT